MKRFISTLILAIMLATASYSFAAPAAVVIVDQDSTSTVQVIGGKLRNLTNTYWEEIAEQDIPDHELIRVFGSHVAIGTTELVLSEAAAGQQFYLTTADEVVATSTSNEDATGGTGALTLQINGMTEDVPGTWVEDTDTITLTGTPGAGTSTKKFIRIDSIVALTAGTTGSNVGTITFTDQGATGTHMKMTPGHGHTKAAIKAIPSGKKLLIRNFWATVSAGKSIEVHLYVREFGGAWQDRVEYSLNDSNFDSNILLDSIPGKSDVQIRVQTTTGSAGAAKAGFLGRTENE
jgi:hypothetical protein